MNQIKHIFPNIQDKFFPSLISNLFLFNIYIPLPSFTGFPFTNLGTVPCLCFYFHSLDKSLVYMRQSAFFNK